MEGYKLTLHTRLRKLPVEDFEIAMNWLPEKIGVRRPTFRRWIYMKASSQNSIPAEAILILASFFGCKPEEMYSNPVDFAQVQAEFEIEKEKKHVHD